MAYYQGIKVVPKIEIKNKEILSLIYTPGVGSSCLKIKENIEAEKIYTNKIDSVAVISFDYEKSLKRAVFLKSSLLIDAYPLCIKQTTAEDLKFAVENIEPNFCGIDLSLISDFVKDIEFKVDIPVLKGIVPDIKEFFGTISRNVFMFSTDKLKGNVSEKSLQLHELAGGVIETELSEVECKKMVAIVSDGTAVLGFGNIGADAALPVMEGKAALYAALAGVSSMPFCIKTQNADEVIKIVQLFENSFSGIHMEDISAPDCFKIENTLIESLKIPVFHDDQHGTAIIVLAAILNALTLAQKELSDVKIVINGAGAAGSAVARLLIFAGVKNLIMLDKDGTIYKGRPQNNENLENLAQQTNPNQEKGQLADEIKGADIFIGLSKGNLVTPDMIKSMNNRPIVFALANPVPEIMPDDAKKAGAYIVGTGRSDFPNQINNSLAFPGVFKGAIDNNIHKITDEIKLNCAAALASIVSNDELSVEKILPEPLDPGVVQRITEVMASKL